MKPHEVHQPDGFVSVLLDTHAEFGDRDDAAMELGAYDEPQAFDGLLAVACDSREDTDLQQRCGESLAEICRRRTHSDADFIARLSPPARQMFTATLNNPNETGNAEPE